jgi:hypothetical protein
MSTLSSYDAESTMTESTPDIFLSYTREETRFVAAVADELSRHGVVARDLASVRFGSGTSWMDPVAEALAASDVVVVFLGASTASPWQNFEIGAALGGRKQVVPVYVSEDAVRTALPTLRDFEGIDAHDRTPHQVADQIVRAIGVAAKA